MNRIERDKKLLIGLGIVMAVLAIISLVFGILLIVQGANALGENGAAIKLALGIMLVIVFFPLVAFGIKCVWVGLALVATKGSIKEGNIAKQGGTVNMKKCDKCGTEIKDGETVCSNCGKPYQD